MKKRNMLAILLAMLMLASCGGGEGTAADDAETGGPLAETETAVETEPDILDGLSYGGRTFRILTSDTDISSNDLIEGSGELNGDNVNDAVYSRNLAVEEQLDVKFAYEHTNNAWGDVYKSVQTLVMSGDSTYDLLIDDQLGFATASIDMLFYDAASLPTVDFTENCWWGEYMKNLSVDYKHTYLLVGDYFMDVLNHSHALLYNRNMYGDVYGDPDEVYRLVEDGAWTYDAWIPMIEGAYQDVNGDGKADKEDRFGMIVGGIGGSSFPFTYGGDVPYITRDKNGYPTLTMYGERLSDLYEKIRQVFWSSGTFTKYTENGVDLHEKFASGGALFISGCQLGDFGTFRDMEEEIGIIPYPKQDEAQANYITVVHDTAEVGGIPATAADPEISGAVCQALCRATHETVLPAYYEMSLKIKYARDNYTSAMIDRIHDGIMDMFSLVYGAQYANNITTWTILEPLQKNGESITTAYETRESAAVSGLADLVTTFEANLAQ